MAIIRRRNSDLPSFNDFLNDDFWSFPTLGKTSQNQPAVNVKENEKEFLLDVAAPGIDKKDIHVHVENDMLVIEGENKYENEDKQGDQYTRREFGYTSFNRSFRLPEKC